MVLPTSSGAPARRLPFFLVAAMLCCVVALVATTPAAMAVEGQQGQGADPAAEAATAGKPAAGTKSAAAPAADAAGKDAASSFESEPLPEGLFGDEGGDEAGSEAAAPQKADKGDAVGKMVFGLLTVLGSIWGVHWLLKRANRSRLGVLATGGGSSDAIEVLATTPLAPNRSLHLVRVGGEVMLVGATEQNITPIGRIDGGVLAAGPTGSADTGFHRTLEGALAGSVPAGIAAGPATAVLPAGGSAALVGGGLVRKVVNNLQMMTAR